MFEKASKSFRALNPSIEQGKTTPRSAQARRRGIMNATERDFAMLLQAQMSLGAIHRWEFEGITLRWHGLQYTPDFVVFIENSGLLGMKLIEVKGPFIGGKFERAVERCRHARTYWPEFVFELHQKTPQGWRQLF